MPLKHFYLCKQWYALPWCFWSSNVANEFRKKQAIVRLIKAEVFRMVTIFGYWFSLKAFVSSNKQNVAKYQKTWIFFGSLSPFKFRASSNGMKKVFFSSICYKKLQYTCAKKSIFHRGITPILTEPFTTKSISASTFVLILKVATSVRFHIKRQGTSGISQIQHTTKQNYWRTAVRFLLKIFL